MHRYAVEIFCHTQKKLFNQENDMFGFRFKYLGKIKKKKINKLKKKIKSLFDVFGKALKVTKNEVKLFLST